MDVGTSFDVTQWEREVFEGVPVYVRAEPPCWFVPNAEGDEALQRLAGGVRDDGVAARRFLGRLPPGRSMDYQGREAYLGSPALRELWLHITNVCNLECAHCLFCSGPGEADGLDTGRAGELIAQARTMGCRLFALTGGEPSLHPGFAELVDACLSDEAAHVAVLTNGMLPARHRDALRRWGSERFHVQVSVDGLAEQHDRLRGAGAFKQLQRHLAVLGELSFPYTVSMCVDDGNIADMAGVVDFAADHGASNLHFMWYFRRGRAAETALPDTDRVFDGIRAAHARAQAHGITVDNVEAMRTQVFAPAGTIHDGSGSGWESAAIGPDGRLYPSAAAVADQALATPIPHDLGEAWATSPVLCKMRGATARDMQSPWRFILGGGDSDHSYATAGTFIGDDPYWPLYRKLALWVIAGAAGVEPEPRGRGLRLKMGDILESCGAHAGVALVHTNCLLAVAESDARTSVRRFYSEAAVSTKADILNQVCYAEEEIRHIPAAFRFRGYGCGSPVADAALETGEAVLDLGSGRGIECFIAARHVGRTGRVIGVDMLDQMLDAAREAAGPVAHNLGYENVEFRKGYLEDLPIDTSSVDVALSNCVLNLSTHKRKTFREICRVLKPGGRLVVSDVVCETDPDAGLRNDEVLQGECIAGALTQADLAGILRETGFEAMRVIKRFPYRVVQDHPFFSMTYSARKRVGAVLGVGIAFSLILSATPLTAEARQAAMRATAVVLGEVASVRAARCCQRETWIALRCAAQVSRDMLPIPLVADARLECTQRDGNRHCMGATCPMLQRREQ